MLGHYQCRVLICAAALSWGVHHAAEAAPASKVTPKTGLDANGNWVDANSAIWMKIIKGDFTYQYAKSQCKMKDAADDIIQWQLPTAKQAEAFYKQTVRPNLLSNAGWELGSIWTSTGGNGFNHQIFNLKQGTLSWAGAPDVDSQSKYLVCVAPRQGFDGDGNYFDGRVLWLKINKDNYTRTAGAEFCAKKDPAGAWRLPTYDQLYELADALIYRTALTKGMTARGWTLGMTLSRGNLIALGVVPNTVTKGFLTCVRS